MTIRETYRSKLNFRGAGVIEFIFWILCPLILVYNVWQLISYARGVSEFNTVAFVFSFIYVGLSLIIVVTAALLSKITFWAEILLFGLIVCRYAVSAITNVLAILGYGENTGWGIFSGIVGAMTATSIIVDIIIITIFVSVIVFIIEHRDIFG